MKTFSKRSFVLLALALALTPLTLTAIPLASAQDSNASLYPMAFVGTIVKSEAVWTFNPDGFFEEEDGYELKFYYIIGTTDYEIPIRRIKWKGTDSVLLVLDATMIPAAGTTSFTRVDVMDGSVVVAFYRGPGFAWSWRW